MQLLLIVTNNNVSAVFTRGQVPRFEGLNEESITLPSPPHDNEDVDHNVEESPPRRGEKNEAISSH